MLQIYGLISISPIGGIKTTNLIRPESSLKSRVVHNKYMDHIVLQLKDSLLIISSVVQDTNVVFLICNGLNDARDSLINGKLYKSLGVINMNEIRDWTKIKGESKWINIIFNDFKNPMLAKHFSFAFETVNLSDLLNFQLSLLDDEAKPIKFAPNEKKYQH